MSKVELMDHTASTGETIVLANSAKSLRVAAGRRMFPCSLSICNDQGNTCVAVGCSSLTTDTWDGSVDVFRFGDGVPPDVWHIPTEAGIAAVCWVYLKNEPLILAGGDDAVVRGYSLSQTSLSASNSIDAPISVLLAGHSDIVSSIDTNMTASVLSTSWDGSLLIWDVSQPQFPVSSIANEAHQKVFAGRWHPTQTSNIAYVDGNGAVCVSDARNGQTQALFRMDHAGSAVCWSRNSDSLVLAGSKSGKLYILDQRMPKEPVSCTKLCDGAVSAIASTSDLTVVACADGALALLNPQKSALPPNRVKVHRDRVSDVQFFGKDVYSIGWDGVLTYAAYKTA